MPRCSLSLAWLHPGGEKRLDRLSLAVLGDVEGASFHHVARVGGDAEGPVDRRVNVFQPDRVLGEKVTGTWEREVERALAD
jgi:hypothetical protein